MGSRGLPVVQALGLVAAAILGGTGCKPANFISVAVGHDIVCGQHASGRWDCYGEANIDMPRDDYLAMSADRGVACGIRPEDDGVECFGEEAPTLPPAAFKSLRYYSASTVYGLTVDGEAVAWWGEGEDWYRLGGSWASFTANAFWEMAYQSEGEVRYWDWDEEAFGDGFDEIAAFDIGETTSASTWIGTDGCFRAEGTMTVGALSEIDCSGPFQPIVVGGLAGNYALAEDGTIHQLDTVDLDGDRLECGAPDGEFKALARGGSLTCGIRTSGSLVCWGPNNRAPDWLNAISDPYAPGEQGGGEGDFRD